MRLMGLEMEPLAVVLVIWVIPAVFAGLYARTKGYAFLTFFATGLAFSVFAAMFVALMLPDRLEEAEAAGPSGAVAISRPPLLLVGAFAAFVAIVAVVAIFV